jgi:hypothetical protein
MEFPNVFIWIGVKRCASSLAKKLQPKIIRFE